MKKLDIYIVRKFLGTFFYAISLLIVIVIVFDISEKIDDFFNNDAPLREILFDYYLNFIPYFVNLFSYLFTFIAVIFFTSKLAANSEIIAFLSSGVSFNRLLVPYIFSAVLLSVLSLYLNNFLIPRTNRTLVNFDLKYLKNPFSKSQMNIHMQIKPGTFIYLETFNHISGTGYKFSLEEFRNDRLVTKIMSERITWDSTANRWKLSDYYIRVMDGLNESLSAGKEMDTLLNMNPKDFLVTVDDIKSMNFWELRSFIDREKLKGSELIPTYEVEKHKRLADPFSTIVLTIIGVSLSSRKVRGGIGMHLGFGIALTFSFILFMQVSTVFATRGSLAPLIAVWIPNLIFSVIALILLKLAPK
ncbi:MAG: LptF/LptG family permease [Bacteroidales bacterium]|nr:LptF/LptG family permease [Bacteroidales bacterium]